MSTGPRQPNSSRWRRCWPGRPTSTGFRLHTIAGHGDHAHTACPGDHLAAYLDSGSVQDAVEALLAAGGVDLRPE